MGGLETPVPPQQLTPPAPLRPVAPGQPPPSRACKKYSTIGLPRPTARATVGAMAPESGGVRGAGASAGRTIRGRTHPISIPEDTEHGTYVGRGPLGPAGAREGARV